MKIWHKLSLVLIACVFGGGLGMRAEAIACTNFPGAGGALQKCIVVGTCSFFGTCVRFICAGPGCGTNEGEACAGGGGCPEEFACSGACN